MLIKIKKLLEDEIITFNIFEGGILANPYQETWLNLQNKSLKNPNDYISLYEPHYIKEKDLQDLINKDINVDVHDGYYYDFINGNLGSDYSCFVESTINNIIYLSNPHMEDMTLIDILKLTNHDDILKFKKYEGEKISYFMEKGRYCDELFFKINKDWIMTDIDFVLSLIKNKMSIFQDRYLCAYNQGVYDWSEHEDKNNIYPFKII